MEKALHEREEECRQLQIQYSALREQVSRDATKDKENQRSEFEEEGVLTVDNGMVAPTPEAKEISTPRAVLEGSPPAAILEVKQRDIQWTHQDVRAHAHTHARTHTHAHARTHTHTCTHTHAHARTHTHMHMHALTHTHARTHTHMHALTHTHAHARTHTHMRIHTHARTHAHTCAHTHTHSVALDTLGICVVQCCGVECNECAVYPTYRALLRV